MPHDNHPDKPKLVRIADIMHPKPVPVTRENESHASDLPEGGTKLFKVVKSRGKRILKVVRPIVRAIRPILPACRDALWPHCSVCNKRLFFRSDKAAELQRLKPLGEYEDATTATNMFANAAGRKLQPFHAVSARHPSMSLPSTIKPTNSGRI